MLVHVDALELELELLDLDELELELDELELLDDERELELDELLDELLELEELEKLLLLEEIELEDDDELPIISKFPIVPLIEPLSINAPFQPWIAYKLFFGSLFASILRVATKDVLAESL